jgi:hypothetical protein
LWRNHSLVEVPSLDVIMREANAAQWAKLIRLNAFLHLDKPWLGR